MSAVGVFDADIAVARELIELYGEACQWQKPAPVIDGDPGYPTIGDVPDPVPCHIAFFSGRDVGRGGGLDSFLAMMRGTEVPQNGEVGLLAGGLTFTPENTDTIMRSDGTEIAIKMIDRLAPNGVPILYYVMVAA